MLYLLSLKFNIALLRKKKVDDVDLCYNSVEWDYTWYMMVTIVLISKKELGKLNLYIHTSYFYFLKDGKIKVKKKNVDRNNNNT